MYNSNASTYLIDLFLFLVGYYMIGLRVVKTAALVKEHVSSTAKNSEQTKRCTWWRILNAHHHQSRLWRSRRSVMPLIVLQNG